MPVSGSDGYRSGIVTLPNRVKLRDMDNRTGMYPTISRTGDKDRTGSNNVQVFNDQDVHVFTSEKQSDYDLSVNNELLNYNIASNLVLWVQFVPDTPVLRVGSTGVSTILYFENGVASIGAGFQRSATDTTSEFNLIGENRYNAAFFSNSSNFDAKITYTSTTNNTTFTNGSGNDSPFSVSFYYYRISSVADSTDEYFFSKADSSSIAEYWAYLDISVMRFVFVLKDESTNNYIVYRASVSQTIDEFSDVMHHIVFTYDGSNSAAGVEIYLDGKKLTAAERRTDSSYAGMENISTELVIGANNSEANEADGYILEFAIYNKELSQLDVNAINDMTSKKFFQRIRLGLNTLSGSDSYLNAYATPNEEAAGLYGYGRVLSTISDQEYLTDYRENVYRNSSEESISAFDESRIEIKQNQFYLTGTSESTYPGFNSKLMNKTQIQIDLSCNEETTFGFTELSTEWHEKGTAGVDQYTNTNDLTNIKQQLMVYYNKDLKRWEKIAHGYGPNTHATGSDGHIDDPNATTVNFFRTLGENVDRAAIGFSPCAGLVATGAIGGSSTGQRDTYPEVVIKSLGKPTSNFGFPSHGKFHGTGSQTIKMSDYINKPFLLEKLSLNFNTKMEFSRQTRAGRYMFNLSFIDEVGGSQTSDYLNNFAALCMPTFFILRQKKTSNVNFTRDFRISFISPDKNTRNSYNSIENYYSDQYYDSEDFSLDFSLPGNFYLNSGSLNQTYVDTDRELVTFGQVSFFISGSTRNTNVDLIDKIPGDKLVKLMNDSHVMSDGTTFTALTNEQIPPLTASITVDFNSRVIPNLPPRFGEYMVIASSSTSGQKMFANMEHAWDGGRLTPFNNTIFPRVDGKILLAKNERVSERALNSGAPSFKVGKTVLQKASSTDTYFPFPYIYPTLENLDVHSPYLLYPEDELIFGWQYPYGENFNNQQPNTLNTDDLMKNKMTLFGASTLTMFGSQIKEGKEFHNTLNQNLTSEAIHEDIGFEDAMCLDQFIINTREEYSGSYLDDYTTGSVGSISKSLIGSGENNLSGSFQRFAKCSSPKELYYDTLIPDIFDQINNSGGSQIASITYAGSLAGDRLVNLNAGWDQMFIYDIERPDRVINTGGVSSIQKGIFRSPDPLKFFKLQGAYGSLALAPFTEFLIKVEGAPATRESPSEEAIPIAVDMSGSSSTNAVAPIDYDHYKYLLYGFGSDPGTKAFRVSHTLSDGRATRVVERPRGWKYGIWSPFKETTSSIYRMDRHTGFVSDMLQQRYDTRFYDQTNNTALEPPVKIEFVTKDNDSQYSVLTLDQVPLNTYESSNLNLYATSSIPFFDEINNPRNRTYDNLLNQTVEVG